MINYKTKAEPINLPYVKGQLHFSYNIDDCSMEMTHTYRSEYGDSKPEKERVVFVRRLENRSGRWRWAGNGPWVSVHTIASMIFKYKENPHQEEMWFMGSFVEEIGSILDAAYQAIVDGVDKRFEKIKQDRARYFQPVTQLNTEGQFKEQKSFIYLMRHNNGLTKIGISNNPKAREKTLQAEDPRLEIIFKAESDNTTERRLHDIFREVRVRGEWFDLMPHHIDWIMFFLKGDIDESGN